jgi:hypothetical protein
MVFDTNRKLFRIFALATYLGFFLAAFFRLPYYFPVSPSVSVSYVYQYSNRVALIIFLIGMAGFAILFRGLSLEPATKDSRISRLTASLAVVACTALGFWDYWISNGQGSIPYYGTELYYFYDRLTQLAAGSAIYRGFEFAYGPLLLYIPFWAGKLFHLSLLHGYILFWLATWPVGIWILFRLVNAIEIPSSYRTAIFLIFTLDFMEEIQCMGLNYTPFRGLLTGGLAMLVYSAYRRHSQLPKIVCMAVVSAAIATGISPEHGIAFMLGTTLFFTLCVKTRPTGFWPAIVSMALCFMAIVAVSMRMGIYTTLSTFSSGGYNFPILPTPLVLFVLALFLIAACVIYLGFQRKQTESLTFYLLCICLFFLPSGFGRADAWHILNAVVFALIIATLALSRYLKALFVVLLIFAAPPLLQVIGPAAAQATPAVFYRSTERALHLLHCDKVSRALDAKVKQHFVKVEAEHQQSLLTDPPFEDGPIVNAPWGTRWHNMEAPPMKVDSGFFSGAENVISPAQVDSIILWLQAHPDRKLLLPKDEHIWPLSPQRCYGFDEGESPIYSTLYGHHWASAKRQMQIIFPLCDYVRSHYAPDPIPFSDQMDLWHPIAANPPLPSK